MTGLTLPHPGRRLGASGVPYLVAGLAVFSVQDLILKLLSGTYRSAKRWSCAASPRFRSFSSWCA